MESKKDAFRKYLEGAGVIDSITKALVTLYEEPDKPVSGIEYLKNSLGAPTKADYDAVVGESESLKSQLEDAKATIEKLQAEVRAHPPPKAPNSLRPNPLPYPRPNLFAGAHAWTCALRDLRIVAAAAIFLCSGF